jgi:5-methylcytosine-specific restriction endonuclease McrA
MPRRRTRNRTGIPRVEGRPVHDAWVGFNCVRCGHVNRVHIGPTLLTPEDAYETARWRCGECSFIHSRGSNLPFPHWPKRARTAESISAQRFWQGFFRSLTENPAAYWKRCGACGRVQPFSAFSRHEGWGPLERQMECRGCKGAINALLNPKRTKQQLHEGSYRRRVGNLLLKGEHKVVNIDELFERFGGKCFKTGKALDISDRGSWAIDHILPSRFLYPLTNENAGLLCREANNNKRDQWPAQFYSNTELKRLAKITGADLSVLASETPVVNTEIDVDTCVDRALKIREGSKLTKRITELKRFLEENGLVSRLSAKNKRLLGFAD